MGVGSDREGWEMHALHSGCQGSKVTSCTCILVAKKECYNYSVHSALLTHPLVLQVKKSYSSFQKYRVSPIVMI